MTDRARHLRGMSVRTRLTVAMAAIAAIAFALIALLAPGAVRSALENDLLAAEAENSSLSITFDPSTFDPEDLIRVADGDLFPFDPELLIGLGGLFGDLLDEFGPDEEEIRQAAADQIQILRSLDRFDLLADAANGEFVIEIGPSTGALVEPDGSFRVVDELVEVVDEGTPVISSGEIDELLVDVGLRPLGSGSFVDTDNDSRTIAGVVEVDGVQVLAAADAGAVDRSVGRVQLGLWLAVPVLTAVVAAVAWLLTSRALRPVGSITERAATISGGSLDARVPVPTTHDEISTLAVTVNEMLDRLEDDDRTRRQFISDASHELRSPVAVIRSDAEIALRHPDTADAQQLAAVVAAESSRLSGIIDDLLALARHDEDVSAVAGGVDLDDVVLAEAKRTRRVPVETARVSAGRVGGRPDELTRLVAHLLDNAARHADSRVAVELRTTERNVELVVDDDGAGIAESDRGRVFDRFVRLDDARSRDEGGAGLGLAVVRSVAERSGGTVRIETSPMGGARFVVTFPT